MAVKMKRITTEKEGNNKTVPETLDHEFGFIKAFVGEKEALVALMKDREETNIPMTIRISLEAMSILDHLAERWNNNRSGLAAELLERVIFQTIYEVYPEKKQPEIRDFVLNLMDELTKKRKREKAKS